MLFRPACKHIAATLSLLFTLGLLLSCGVGGGLVTGSAPRWACPSPLPLPWGSDGPIKERITLPTAIPTGPTAEQVIYYEEWEREYGPGGVLLGANPPFSGPPFPSPTPYTVVGTNYVLGQRVQIGAFHLQVTARAGAVVDRPGVPPRTQQLYYVDLTWLNHGAEAVPIDYGERVRLRAVTASDGRVVTDANWGMSAEALQVSGRTAPPDTIPPGESSVTLPILGPIGTPKTVDVSFLAIPGFAPAMPVATAGPGTPAPTATPQAPLPTPTPNSDLRSTAPQFLTVQWTDTTLRVGPPCDDAGAITGWSSEPWQEWGTRAEIGMEAPPGAGRLIQLALEQVGKRYVWGAKGPEQFDCSGLVAWLYAQIGVQIPLGTGGQWPRMRPVALAQLQPGDLVFFDIAGRGRVDHVGMLVGDLDGDGRWDMVHAANPDLGVRVDYGIFQSAYYASRIAGFRTAR